jgi:hypothetical protein
MWAEEVLMELCARARVENRPLASIKQWHKSSKAPTEIDDVTEGHVIGDEVRVLQKMYIDLCLTSQLKSFRAQCSRPECQAGGSAWHDFDPDIYTCYDNTSIICSEYNHYNNSSGA